MEEQQTTDCGHGPAHAQCFECGRVMCVSCWVQHMGQLAAVDNREWEARMLREAAIVRAESGYIPGQE